MLRNSSFSFPMDLSKDTNPILTKFEAVINDEILYQTMVKDGSVQKQQPI